MDVFPTKYLEIRPPTNPQNFKINDPNRLLFHKSMTQFISLNSIPENAEPTPTLSSEPQPQICFPIPFTFASPTYLPVMWWSPTLQQALDLYFFIFNCIISMWNTPFLPAPFSFFFYQQFIPQNQYTAQDLNPSALENCKDSPTREAVIDNSPQVAQFQLKSVEERAKVSAEQRRRCVRREKLKKRRERQDNFQRKQQKKDRNLPSNILKNFLHLLTEERQFIRLNHLFSRLDISISFPILIQKLKKSVDLSKNYIRPALVKSLCRQDVLSAQESLFFRVALKYYLRQHFPMVTICTMKIKKRQRLDYLKICRRLEELYSRSSDAPSS